MNTIHDLSRTDRRADQRRRQRTARRLVATSIVGIALLAACGGDDDDDSGATTATAGAEATTASTAGGGLYGDDTSASTAAPATEAPGTEAPASSAPAASGAAMVATAETDLGTVLVDANGMTLYAFTPDGDAGGEPTCFDDCAAAWPPAIVDGEPTVGEGLDASVFSTVENPDGTQLKAGDWPLYTFANDAAPGDTNGQGISDVWYVVAPDGTLIK